MNNDIFLEQVAYEIKSHRKQAGLSQQDLARLSGVGKTVIYDIEHQKKTIKLNTLIKILNVLNISIEINSPLIKLAMNNNSGDA